MTGAAAMCVRFGVLCRSLKVFTLMRLVMDLGGTLLTSVQLASERARSGGHFSVPRLLSGSAKVTIEWRDPLKWEQQKAPAE
jgi:hypothetical protein